MRVHEVACEGSCAETTRLEDVAEEEDDRVFWVVGSVDERICWECVWDIESLFMGNSRDVMTGQCRIEYARFEAAGRLFNIRLNTEQ